MSKMLNQPPNYAPPLQDTSTHEIDVAAILHQLWKHRWLLCLTACIGLFFGVFYAKRQPPEYESSALIQVEGKSAIGGSAGGGPQLFNSGLGNSAQTEITLIQSRFILDPVIDALGLAIHTSQQPGSLKERLFPRLRKQVLPVTKFDVPDSELNHAFQVVVDKPGQVSLYGADSRLILSGSMGKVLTTPDKQFRLKTEKAEIPKGTRFNLRKGSETAVLNGLVSRLKVDEKANKTRVFQGTGVLELFLKGGNQYEIVRVLNAIVETARLKDGEKQTKEASQTLSFLHKQLPETKQALQSAEEKLNKHRVTKGKLDLKTQTKFLLSEVMALDKELAKLQLQKIQMHGEYKEAHPIWGMLANQIKALKKQRSDLMVSLKTLPTSDLVAVNLMREVELKQSLYLLLLNKIQELEVLKAGITSGIRVLSYAALPDAPLSNKSKLNGLSGLVFGFLFGVMIIFARKLLLPRVEDPHWTERQLSLPNMVTLPYCKKQAETDGQALQVTDKVSLLAKTNPKDLTVEVLRSLRTSLQTTLICATNNMISILGVSPNVGKTFVSSNLAYLLATGGKRVLLIDGDLRRGTLHKAFSLSSSPGLANVLEDSCVLDKALRTTVHENLTVLPRGNYPKDPSELLTSERFKALVKTFSEQYDLVLFDTAPVLLVTDAALIASFSATNYLVVGAGEHSPKDIELTLKRLRNNGVQVTGSIFNFHREADGKNSYYYNYNYNYNYGYYAHSEDELI
ncbi:MAG: polysaccharide biosynthesis tyrosine autokinase [Legionella sp.]|nr:polysaccharide biosynthesis tyrosine autokinase [Legionella sp.]